jgi:hypothetical protein
MTTVEPRHEPPLTPETSVAGPYDKEMREAGQLTSPTWELELFLSGAFVFAMLQLPGLIEQLFVALEPHTTDRASQVLFMGVLYGKAIAFTLIGMFLLHLIARAYWVALLGLQSVFPRGVQWKEMKIGPVGTEVYRAFMPDIGRLIARLDNFCSIVFSVGLIIVFVFVFSTMVVAAGSGLAYGLALVFTHGQNMRYFFYLLMLVFVAIPVSATMVDKARGDRYPPGTRGHRILRALMRFAFGINLTPVIGPMMWTLATNLGRKKSVVFLYVALTGLILVAVADRLAQSDRLSINSYDYFGASRTRAVNSRFYESQRLPGKSYARAPSIQSDIIKDPYVKLFIPYSPRRDNPAIASTCPTLKPIADRGLQIGADVSLPDSITVPVLSCIARMHAVSLDSAPRPDVEFSFYEHPTTGVKGVIAYIAVDSLPRGRHVIGVVPTPPTPLPKDSAVREDWKRPTLIPFWK